MNSPRRFLSQAEFDKLIRFPCVGVHEHQSVPRMLTLAMLPDFLALSPACWVIAEENAWFTKADLILVTPVAVLTARPRMDFLAVPLTADVLRSLDFKGLADAMTCMDMSRRSFHFYRPPAGAPFWNLVTPAEADIVRLLTEEVFGSFFSAGHWRPQEDFWKLPNHDRMQQEMNASPPVTTFPIYFFQCRQGIEVLYPADRRDIGHTEFWEQEAAAATARAFGILASRIVEYPYCQRRARVAGNKVYYGEAPDPAFLEAIRAALGNPKLIFVYDDHEKRLPYDIEAFEQAYSEVHGG